MKNQIQMILLLLFIIKTPFIINPIHGNPISQNPIHIENLRRLTPKAQVILLLPSTTWTLWQSSTTWSKNWSNRQEMEQLIKEVKLPAHKNLALCHLKLNENMACVQQCEEVLKVEPNCIKTLYRIAKAYMNLQYLQA